MRQIGTYTQVKIAFIVIGIAIMSAAGGATLAHTRDMTTTTIRATRNRSRTRAVRAPSTAMVVGRGHARTRDPVRRTKRRVRRHDTGAQACTEAPAYGLEGQ